MTTLLLIHAAATLLMTGLVLFVGVVHYPLMAHVGRDAFINYELHHTRRTTWIVAPLMLTEAATAVALLVMKLNSPLLPWAVLSTALLGIAWGITFLINVPQHARLSQGFDPRIHTSLVRTHWIRTLAWVLRSALALVFLLPPGQGLG